MLFVIHGLDKPQSRLREQHIEQHRQYLNDSPVRVISSGPLVSEVSGQMIGSLVIVDCDDRQAVDAFMADEPFNRLGLYQSLHIHCWQQRVGEFVEQGPLS